MKKKHKRKLINVVLVALVGLLVWFIYEQVSNHFTKKAVKSDTKELNDKIYNLALFSMVNGIVNQNTNAPDWAKTFNNLTA
jgi:uncharacterized membrane protein